MKQKKLFSIKLYIEGLRQLRVLGMLGLIINALIGIIIPMGYYLSMEEEYNALNSFSKLNCVITETHCYFFLFVFVFSPLMVLSLFHFLNKREDCDFYHSIPQTRGCLYVSYSAAMVTWLLIQILTVSIISAICYCAASKYLIIDIPGIFFFAVNIFVASLLSLEISFFFLFLLFYLLHRSVSHFSDLRSHIHFEILHYLQSVFRINFLRLSFPCQFVIQNIPMIL